MWNVDVGPVINFTRRYTVTTKLVLTFLIHVTGMISKTIRLQVMMVDGIMIIVYIWQIQSASDFF